MRKPVILITGANGEIGHGLIEYFGETTRRRLVALDLDPLDASLRRYCDTHLAGDILDENLLQRLVSEYEIHEIYHLAALLSTRAEYSPETAHKVNVNGTLNLLQLAHDQARWHGQPVKFLFPSSIAVYGLPNLEAKIQFQQLREREFNFPTTMYGCTKLYCEQLGRYYSLHYRQLAADPSPSGVDFRAIRFPGIISAKTVPTGGTSDFAPEMVHAAAQRKPYACFVREEARIPFMAMPDAIRALVSLGQVPAERIEQRIYTVGSFSPTAGEFRDIVLSFFPEAEITFAPDPARAAIVDTWPADVDDTPARHEWDWQPHFDLERTFREYLVPTIRERYEETA